MGESQLEYLKPWCDFFDFRVSPHANKAKEKKVLEARGIDPRTFRMLSERSTIWAKPPEQVGAIHTTVNDRNCA